ncbi:MAG: hypothetical protein ACRDBM_16240 [Sporomusa sp.]
MKKLAQQLLNSFLSLATTLMIMAAPVAAIVYASEPTVAVEHMSLDESSQVAYSESVKDNMVGLMIYEGDDKLPVNFSTK